MPSNVRLAYILLVHKNPEQVNAFVRQITLDPRADVYIHIDAKCPEAMVRAIEPRERVNILKERMSVTWGDFNTIEATLLLMRAVRASGKSYDFVSLNSGQDLLVRDGLLDFLAENRGRSFIEAAKYERNDLRNSCWRIRWPRTMRNLYDSPLHPYRVLRFSLSMLYRCGINLRPNPHSLPANWLFHRGSQWFCITSEAADFILDYVARDPSFCAVFEDSLVPDMGFFQTLIMNSPFASQVTGENLTYLNFGKTFKDNNHPVILTMNDVAAIESSGRFFARKFEQDIDKDVISYFSAKAEAWSAIPEDSGSVGLAPVPGRPDQRTAFVRDTL